MFYLLMRAVERNLVEISQFVWLNQLGRQKAAIHTGILRMFEQMTMEKATSRFDKMAHLSHEFDVFVLQ